MSQEVANALVSDPPQTSPPAFCILKPSRYDARLVGVVGGGVAIPAASAPVAVMILNVEPGGCTDVNAIPAAASIAPVRGFITVMPP